MIQGVQELQAFPICVVNFNDEHVKPRFKSKLRDYISRQNVCRILFKALV